MAIDYEKLWKDALVEIEFNLSRANFATWFKNTSISGYENGVIFINVPSGFVKEWLSNKYHKFIIKALRDINSNIRNIEYCIVAQTIPPVKNEQAKMASAPAHAEEQLGFNEFYADKEANLNPKYTFDSYIVGSFNEVANAAALSVAKNLGTAYNPLFIYGGVGLGKTHLIQAIGNKVKENNPENKVLYLTSEKFTTEFINSIQNKNTYSFKEKYRKYNFLIIDDIQFFANKLKVQEEFFHIFNTLYERNSQIVFSSDKPPKYIVGLEERLRSRFEGGMIVDVSPPEFEARLAIIREKARLKGYPLSDEILEYIASAIQENIRELEGALNSVIGQSKIKGKILNQQEVKDILKKNAKPIKTLTINHVIKTIADFYNIEEKNLFEKTRKKEIVMPRQIAMYLLREDLSISYPYIGQKFGQRDHTTVIHAYKKINNSIKNNDRLNQELAIIRNILYEKSA
ncbi:chromosomal replication initiator protein DnaA [Candidatus Parcubacteria bacterium]|nr:chromosomal replication initiator protein DnaA [Patescibacteria group bacterium]MBU4477388.1 chromosomal replication initiator protein DnaA [Patescibacteria group bacterium]MCG2698868.1 chromosomal replication initiator protein DnaA [Candidatus Parcubacteria bacterium]